MTSPVLLSPQSSNRKLSPVRKVVDDSTTFGYRLDNSAPFVAATHLPMKQTCPRSCPFLDNGCMAESGFTRVAISRLETAAEGLDELDIIRAEAEAIDDFCSAKRSQFRTGGGRDGKQGRDIRLHVSGDCGSDAGAELLAAAARRYTARGGGRVWTFSHNWRSVRRTSWGPVSVLASVESAGDGHRAARRGYVPALVVDRFEGATAFERGGTTWIPCPAETRGTTCVECRLCLDRTEWMRETSRGIAFAVHGQDAAAAARRLPVVR